MKSLDPTAAAAEIKSAVENAQIIGDEKPSWLFTVDYVKAVCAALEVEDTPANLVLVTRELVHAKVLQHVVQEYPKHVTALDGSNVIAESAAHEKALTTAPEPQKEPAPAVPEQPPQESSQSSITAPAVEEPAAPAEAPIPLVQP